MNKIILALSLLVSSNVMAATASWYGPGFHGKRTASGDIFNQNSLTAAHNKLPFNSKVKVTNLRNNKSVVVRINDRGGFKKYGRTIDLSKKANSIINCGLCKVSIKVLSKGDGKYRRK